MKDAIVKDTNTSLASLLRQERAQLGYSLATLSRLSGIPKSVLGSWEAGTRRPSGPNLEAVLQTLKVEDGRRSLILYQTDRVHASKALAHERLKTPAGQAELLRSIRFRSEMSQAEVARLNGTTQSAVAKWESGDRVLESEDFLRVFASMGASPEEIQAAAQFEAVEDNPILTPADAWSVLADIRARTPWVLRELRAIILEAQLWRKATLDSRFHAPLVSCLDLRAQILEVESRWSELDAVTERTLELASAEGLYDEAFYAAYCLVGPALSRRISPSRRAYRHYEEWGERCSHKDAKADVQMGLAMARQEFGASRALGRDFFMELLAISERPVESKIGFHKGMDPLGALIDYATCVVDAQYCDEALMTVEDHLEPVLGLGLDTFFEKPEMLRSRPRTKVLLLRYVVAKVAFKEPVPRPLWQEIKQIPSHLPKWEVRLLTELILRTEKRIRLKD